MKKNITIIVLSIFVVVLAGITFYFWQSGQKDEKVEVHQKIVKEDLNKESNQKNENEFNGKITRESLTKRVEDLRLDVDEIMQEVEEKKPFYCEKDSDCKVKTISRGCFIGKGCANNNVNYEFINPKISRICSKIDVLEEILYPNRPEMIWDELVCDDCKCVKNKCTCVIESSLYKKDKKMLFKQKQKVLCIAYTARL